MTEPNDGSTRLLCDDSGCYFAGAALSVVGLDPVRALYWAAVVNGVLASPLMAVMMLIVRNPKVMGRLTLSRSMAIWGWGATAVMAAASFAFFILP